MLVDLGVLVCNAFKTGSCLAAAATKVVLEHPDFAATHNGVPWASMKGMRNRMAHGYWDVDFETRKASLVMPAVNLHASAAAPSICSR